MTSMSMMEFAIEVSDAGVVTVPGVDFSNRTPMTLVEQRGVYLAVHKPAGKCWSSIGMRSYVPASMLVFQIVGKDEQGRYVVQQLVDAPVRPVPQALKAVDLG